MKVPKDRAHLGSHSTFQWGTLHSSFPRSFKAPNAGLGSRIQQGVPLDIKPGSEQTSHSWVPHATLTALNQPHAETTQHLSGAGQGLHPGETVLTGWKDDPSTLSKNDTKEPMWSWLLLSGQDRGSTGEVAAEGPWFQPLADQNSTWGRKCICLVALFFIPIFSIHFDFILWTYCMSRWRTRAAPGGGKGVRMRQRALSCDQRKPNLAENQSWFRVSGL